MTNAEIVRTLDKLAFFLSLHNECEEKINAYRRAAKNLSRFHPSIEEMVLVGADLTKIPGIGKVIAKKIEDILIIGESRFLAPYRDEYPESLWELSQIKGLSTRTMILLFKNHQVCDLKQLQANLNGGPSLGLGASLEEKLRDHFGR